MCGVPKPVACRNHPDAKFLLSNPRVGGPALVSSANRPQERPQNGVSAKQCKMTGSKKRLLCSDMATNTRSQVGSAKNGKLVATRCRRRFFASRWHCFTIGGTSASYADTQAVITAVSMYSPIQVRRPTELVTPAFKALYSPDRAGEQSGVLRSQFV